MKFLDYFLFLNNYKIKIIFILLLFLSVLIVLFDVISIFALLPLVTSFSKNNFYENKSFSSNYIPDWFNSYLLSYKSIDLFYLIIVIFLFRNFINIFNNYIVYRFLKHLEITTSRKVFYLWLNKTYLDFYKQPSSEIIKDFKDSVGGYVLFVENVIRYLSNSLILFLFLSILFIISPKETFFVLLYYSAIYFSFNNFLSQFSLKHGKKVNIASNQINSSIINVYKNFSEIILRKLKKKFLELYLNNIIKFSSSRLIISFINLSVKQFFEIFIILFIIILFFFFDLLKMYNSDDILSLITIFLLSAYRIMPLANNLVGSKIKLKNFEFSYKIINNFIKNFNKKTKIINFIYKKDIKLNFLDKIVFKNISYKYSNKKDFLIKKINFYIKKNEILGIIGDSGQGKTTLIKIILGLITPSSGEILLDDQKITKKYIYSYQNFFGYLSQENLFITGSIKDNIAFGDDNPNTLKVLNSLKEANCFEFVSRLKNNINHLVSENGKNFSYGQMQRLSLARVIYFNNDIIVLDEPTSSLDSNAEKKFLNLISNLRGKKTIIIISHRKSTLKICNRIYNIRDGNLIK
jgi:ABC-type bacteriocin/lantibiotic exporter with double-glycine peptidase domain